MRWKKWLWAAAAVAAGLIALPRSAGALETLQGDTCMVEAERVIDGSLLVLCGTLMVNGTVTGNVIGGAFYADINGTVQGDVYLLAGQLDIHGTVADDVVFVGAALRLHPASTLASPTSGIISLGLSTEIKGGAVVPHAVTALNYQLIVNGTVGGDVNFWGSALVLNGTVGGSVDAVVGDPAAGDGSQLQALLLPFRLEVTMVSPGLVVGADGRVEGALRYSGPAPGLIEGALADEPVYTPAAALPDLSQITLGEQSNLELLQKYLGHILAEFITLLAVGVVGLALAPRVMLSPAAHLRSRPLASLGVGLLAFLMSFGVLFLLALLALLLFGLGLLLRLPDLSIIAVMGLGLFVVGGSGGFYFVAIYLSRVVVCLAAGRAVIRAVVGDDGSQRIVYLGLAVGTAALAVLVWLPLVGALANGLALGLGLGATMLLLQQRGARRAIPGVPSPGLLPTHSAAARQMPPPIYEAPPAGPGMDNLPEGFRWWDDDDPQP